MGGSVVAEPATAPVGVTVDERPGLVERWYWLWPALLVAAAGGWKLATPALWGDELATWGAVRLDWSDLFRLSRHVDVVVTPYYVVAKAWTGLAGTSPVALRLPSVVAMAGAAALVAVLGAGLRDRWTGLGAGVAFAAIPATSRFAQEARPYAFVVLLATVATALLIRFLRTGGRGTGAAYASTVALIGALHLIGLLLLLAHALVVRRRWAGWAVWAGCGVLPVLPLVWLGHGQLHQVAWIPPAHLHAVLAAPQDLFGDGVVAGAVIALAALAVTRRDRVVLLAGWALVPLLALAVVAQFTPLFWPRYLTYTLPGWAVLAGLALSALSRVRAVAILAAVAVLGAPAQTAIRQGDGHGQDTRGAARVIADNYRTGDAIAYSLNESAPWLARDVVSRYVPVRRRPVDVFAVGPQRTDGMLAAPECADLAGCLDRVDPSRVWVVRLRTEPDPLRGIGAGKAALLGSRYRMSQLWLRNGFTIALYARD